MADITSVELYGRCKYIIAGGVNPWWGVNFGLQIHDGYYWGTEQQITKDYANYHWTWTTNPYTGNPWQWADINTIQYIIIGLYQRSASGWEVHCRCTQLYCQINYDGGSDILRPIGDGYQDSLDKYGDDPYYKCIDDVTPDEDATYITSVEHTLPGGYDTGYYLIPALIHIPTVTTDPATDVKARQATLNGTLNDDGGEACQCGFQWGETVAYGNTTPTQSRTTGQTFAQTITGLKPNTTYHFRAFATNSAGTGYGLDATFTTLPAFAGINPALMELLS